MENILLPNPISALQQIQWEVRLEMLIDDCDGLPVATESIINGFRLSNEHNDQQNTHQSDNHEHKTLNATIDTARVKLLKPWLSMSFVTQHYLTKTTWT